jgi:hypothetical protein
MELFICNPLKLYAQLQAWHGPSFQLLQFLPETGQILTNGTTITMLAIVKLNPDPVEAVEYTAMLIVNGHRYRPYVTGLLPGTSGEEKPSWLIRVTGPRMTIKLQLHGVGKSSGIKFDFVDICQNYRVKCSPEGCFLWRFIQRLFGCCS